MRDQVDEMLAALAEAARVASVMVDGDEARRIITPRAMHYIAHPDPEHRTLAGDYYDVDRAAFLRTKKTMLRLERLLDFPCSASLWVPVEGLAGYVTLAVHNGDICDRYYRFGQVKMAAPPEMADCLAAGRVVVAPIDPAASETLSVLAPVFDSLGDAVAVVELSAMHPASSTLAPAWS